jgi:2-polyprenyl-6-methoxyphenol hydroxylase-like FAD-dependent oxidoreductase
LPAGGFDTTVRAEERRGWAAAPTHDDLTVLPFGWPVGEFRANRTDIEGHFFAAIALAPEFAERVHAARRESKFVGSAQLPGYFRKPYGPGWALVGDAGYHKNPITAMGINDAFRDAELLADAVDDVFSGRHSFEEAMGNYQRARDAGVGAIYEFTDDFAQLHPPPPQMQQLIAAMRGDQEAMDGFVSVQAATLAAEDFFAPDNVARIMARAGTAP